MATHPHRSRREPASLSTRPEASRLAAPSGTARRVVPDKRDAIMQAALDLFVERGFFGTAVPEIAEHAGVGAGTIYRYFASKEALVNAIYRREKMRFAQIVIDEFPTTVATREQFRVLFTRMAKFAAAHTTSFVFLELHHHASYLDAESRGVEEHMLALFTDVVVAAQARGELKVGEPRLLMAIIMGAFVGIIRSCLELEQPLDQADWKLAEQCLWESVRS